MIPGTGPSTHVPVDDFPDGILWSADIIPPELDELFHGDGEGAGHHPRVDLLHTSDHPIINAVFGIRDIWVLIRIRIWIRGSVLVTNGSRCGSCSFRQ